MTGPATAGDAELHMLSPALLHELRTPLGQIIGYAELLLERAEEGGDERFVPDLQKVSAAGRQMLVLIEDHFTALPTPDARAADGVSASQPRED
jgi:signal transduction histidine kinase